MVDGKEIDWVKGDYPRTSIEFDVSASKEVKDIHIVPIRWGDNSQKVQYNPDMYSFKMEEYMYNEETQKYFDSLGMLKVFKKRQLRKIWAVEAQTHRHFYKIVFEKAIIDGGSWRQRVGDLSRLSDLENFPSEGEIRCRIVERMKESFFTREFMERANSYNSNSGNKKQTVLEYIEKLFRIYRKTKILT